MIAKINDVCEAEAINDRIAAVEMTGVYHKPVQDPFRIERCAPRTVGFHISGSRSESEPLDTATPRQRTLTPCHDRGTPPESIENTLHFSRFQPMIASLRKAWQGYLVLGGCQGRTANVEHAGEDYLTIKSACERLGVSPNTLRTLGGQRQGAGVSSPDEQLPTVPTSGHRGVANAAPEPESEHRKEKRVSKKWGRPRM